MRVLIALDQSDMAIWTFRAFLELDIKDKMEIEMLYMHHTACCETTHKEMRRNASGASAIAVRVGLRKIVVWWTKSEKILENSLKAMKKKYQKKYQKKSWKTWSNWKRRKHLKNLKTQNFISKPTFHETRWRKQIGKRGRSTDPTHQKRVQRWARRFQQHHKCCVHWTRGGFESHQPNRFETFLNFEVVTKYRFWRDFVLCFFARFFLDDIFAWFFFSSVRCSSRWFQSAARNKQNARTHRSH